MKIKERIVNAKNNIGEWCKNHKEELLFGLGASAGCAIALLAPCLKDRLLYEDEASLVTIGRTIKDGDQAELEVHRLNRFGNRERKPLLHARYMIDPENPNGFGNYIADWTMVNNQNKTKNEN